MLTHVLSVYKTATVSTVMTYFIAIVKFSRSYTDALVEVVSVMTTF